jgi:hypothetical protein
MRNTQAATTGKRLTRTVVRCEIVRVASPEFLIDPYQRACRYETANGEPLRIGYYLALWPAGAAQADYGRALSYVGPLPTQAAARLLKTSALGLGIVAWPERSAALPNLPVTPPHPPHLAGRPPALVPQPLHAAGAA